MNKWFCAVLLFLSVEGMAKPLIHAKLETFHVFKEMVKEIEDLREKKRVLQGTLRKGALVIKRRAKQEIANHQHTGKLYRSISVFNSRTSANVQVGAKARKTGGPNASAFHLNLFMRGTGERRLKRPRAVNINGKFAYVTRTGKMPAHGNFLEVALRKGKVEAGRKMVAGYRKVLLSRIRVAARRAARQGIRSV